MIEVQRPLNRYWEIIFMVNDITVEGSMVIYHASQYRPFETKVDFTPHLKLITSKMGQLVLSNKPRIIGIEGVSSK